MNLLELKIAASLLRGAEKEIDRQLRLTRLGELAGSIIHEVNQPLGTIISSADAALRWLDRETPDVDAAMRSIKRVRTVASGTGQTVADLQSLSSNNLINLTERSLNCVADEALQISRPQIDRAGVKTQICFDANPAIAKVNTALLLQVMLNLIQNAIDSMCEVLDRERAFSVRTFAAADSVFAEFEDSGLGLPDGPTAQLFHPLYTTKKSGMGLGLALCRRVIIAHGGSIRARSNSSYGATFVISLPRVKP